MIEFILLNLIFGSVFLGQTLKIGIPFLPNVTILPTDIIIGAVALASLVRLIKRRQIQSYLRKVSKAPLVSFLFFLTIASISFAYNFSTYTKPDALIALAYLIRLLAIFFAMSSIGVRNKENLNTLFIVWSTLIVFAGFVQYVYMPNFSEMAALGWDPHYGRMLSTFFDPNYFGAFLVLVMAFAISYTQGFKKRKYLVILFVLCWLGLYLTFSRSAWLVGAVAVPLTMWPKSWKKAILLFSIFVVIVVFPNRLGSRLLQSSGFFNSLRSGERLQEDTEDADISSSSRGVSLRRAWELSKKNWIIGAGYNAYGPALYRDKIIDKPLSGMSSQGSDSSLLNVFATTGLIGLIFFSVFWISLMSKSKKNWAKKNIYSFIFPYTIAIFIGAFFNNLLFYNLIMIPFYLFAFNSKQQESDEKKQY